MADGRAIATDRFGRDGSQNSERPKKAIADAVSTDSREDMR
jgi:hypothetical protein